MGNHPSSASVRCFDEHVTSTLSWAEKKGGCRQVFTECQSGNDDESLTEIMHDDVRETPETARPEPSYIPALTDDLSSSDPEEPEMTEDGKVIIVLDGTQLQRSQPAPEGILFTSSTSYESGSAGRDARIDLGTLRGGGSSSCGGREGCDDPTVDSELFTRQERRAE